MGVVATTVALLGTGGYGRIHLDRLAGLVDRGRVELVAVADPAGPSDLVPAGTPVHADLEALLGEHTPEVVIVSTPIHTHAPLAIHAMEAGADVYVEKPPAAGTGPFEQMREAAARAGRSCQVGFQSYGSLGLARVGELIAEGAIGSLQRFEARGMWLRTTGYYQRSPWAGRRRDGEVVVADGVTTNPLSHSVSAALHLAGLDRVDRIGRITTELYHAHPIEADDTSFIRVDPVAEDGVPVLAALTVCAPEHEVATVTAVGTEGRIVFHYTEDVVHLLGPDGEARSTEQTGRIDLFENLLDHRDDPTVELLSPLERSSGFTAVLQAILDAPEPRPLPDAAVEWVGEQEKSHPVLEGIGDWSRAALADGGGYAAAGAPWASTEAVTVHDLSA